MRAIQLIPMIVLGLVVAGLVTSAGVKVLANFRSSTVSGLDATTVTNESATIASGKIALAFSEKSIITGLSKVYVNHTVTYAEVTIGTDVNVSSGYSGTGIVSINTNYSDNNATKITYSYKNRDSVLNATVNAMDGTTEISGQFGTIGIVAAMVIILMMIGGLTAYFGLR